MKPARRPKRYDDILDIPETKVAEIIDGEVIVSPRPASPHALAASVLGADLLGAFHRPPGDERGPGGWWLLDEPELHFHDDVLVPDQAGWRRERLPSMPKVAAFTLAPDWVCEVISPSTGRIDRSRKMRIYAREGVAWLWLVDPLLRTIEVYALRDGEWVVKAVHAGDASARIAPFDAVELEVARWWLDSSEP
jgi:Uma2 family endonuclease